MDMQGFGTMAAKHCQLGNQQFTHCLHVYPHGNHLIKACSLLMDGYLHRSLCITYASRAPSFVVLCWFVFLSF